MIVGLIGYGEVGKILSAALAAGGQKKVIAYDILLKDAKAAAAMKERAAKDGVQLRGSPAELLADAQLVISAVTASAAHDVAVEAAKSIRPGTWFVDLNSCSPKTKSSSAQLIDAAGGRFVESAVMTSVPPYGIKVPMQLGGPHAAELASLLAPLGFSVEVASAEIGYASAIKMCRSVVIKGMEAIFVESLISARRYGVEQHVLASLQETFPTIDWEQQASYFFSRVAQHGKRRAEEMREVAVTVREAGLDPHMAAATAERQDWMAKLAARGAFAGVGAEAGWREYADAWGDKDLAAPLKKSG